MCSIGEVTQLTELADYYCCLPILSRTLDSAILANKDKDEWYDSILEDPCTTLTLAQKLRNAALFRDAMVFAVGNWETPAYEEKFQSNDKLYKVADIVYNRLGASIAIAQRDCMTLIKD